jgi:hypothetical protein
MSKTGDALEALFSALEAKAAEEDAAIPAPLQNEDLPARLMSMGSSMSMLLNIWDDSEDDPEELLGAANVDDCYELEPEIPIEFIVCGGTRQARRAAFEAGLEAIHDAITADTTLNSTVDFAEMKAPRRTGSGLITDGMANVLAAEIRVRLSFTSSRPF